MTKSYFTYLSTVIILHGLVLMGTLQLTQSDAVKSQLTQLGTRVLKLQLASKVLMNTDAVQKKTVADPLTNPLRPKTDRKEEEVKLKAQAQTVAAAGFGSEHGTTQEGLTDALTVYKAELRAVIDKNKYYPTLSKRLGQTGTVVIAFTLLKDGNIVDVRIARPSQYERLNDSALDAVKKVERFKPLPQEVANGRMDITVPVNFKTI